MMKRTLEDILAELKAMMNQWNYPVEKPADREFIESIIKRKNNSFAHPGLEKMANEIHFLFSNQPDYINFLESMDGFECNGVTLFSLSKPEPLIKNIFVINDFYRNNNEYINPDLQKRIVTGSDSLSLFTYDTQTNLFEIRDKTGTDNVFDVFDEFSDFLNEIVNSAK